MDPLQSGAPAGEMNIWQQRARDTNSPIQPRARHPAPEGSLQRTLAPEGPLRSPSSSEESLRSPPAPEGSSLSPQTPAPVMDDDYPRYTSWTQAKFEEWQREVNQYLNIDLGYLNTEGGNALEPSPTPAKRGCAVSLDDVMVCFSEEQWKDLEKEQKEVYKDTLNDMYALLVSIGFPALQSEALLKLEYGEERYVQMRRNHKTDGHAEGQLTVDQCLQDLIEQVNRPRDGHLQRSNRLWSTDQLLSSSWGGDLQLSNAPKPGNIQMFSSPKTGDLQMSNTPTFRYLPMSNTPRTGNVELLSTPWTDEIYMSRAPKIGHLQMSSIPWAGDLQMLSSPKSNHLQMWTGDLQMLSSPKSNHLQMWTGARPMSSTLTRDMPMLSSPKTRRVPISNTPRSRNLQASKTTSIGGRQIGERQMFRSPRTPDLQMLNMTRTPDLQMLNMTRTPDLQMLNMTRTPDLQMLNMTRTPDLQMLNMTRTPDLQMLNMTLTPKLQMLKPNCPDQKPKMVYSGINVNGSPSSSGAGLNRANTQNRSLDLRERRSSVEERLATDVHFPRDEHFVFPVIETQRSPVTTRMTPQKRGLVESKQNIPTFLSVGLEDSGTALRLINPTMQTNGGSRSTDQLSNRDVASCVYQATNIGLLCNVPSHWRRLPRDFAQNQFVYAQMTGPIQWQASWNPASDPDHSQGRWNQRESSTSGPVASGSTPATTETRTYVMQKFTPGETASEGPSKHEKKAKSKDLHICAACGQSFGWMELLSHKITLDH